MRVLVEGVETEGQLALLAAHRCDGIQGYWFSPPVSPADFERLLRDGKRLPARYVNGAQRSKTLLLVDDEENILSALKRVLRRDGYQIICASSAREGLQRLAECEVDVIVSDQRMPGMTGVEFLRLAKELFPDTVRIVLSGYTELQSIIDAVNEGAIYRFLTKPWDDERLRAHVAEAFRHKAMADENRRLSMQVETANAELAAMNQRLQQAIDGQREQSDLIAASAEGFREVLNQLPAAVMGVDPEGLITFANREALALLPGAEAMLGQRAATALPPPLQALLDDGAAVTSSIAWGSAAFSVTRRRLEHQGAARGLVFTFIPQAGAQSSARGLS